MSNPNIRDELEKEPYQPLLPIETKLIGWSLGIGIALPAVLIGLTRFIPPPA